MEYSQTRQWVDHATFAFVNRNLPVPEFDVSTANGITRVSGKYFDIQYVTNSTVSFNVKNLQATIMFDGKTAHWAPTHNSDIAPGNLFGTVRTLDGVQGDANLNCYENYRHDQHCAYGMVSRAGFVVVDDTHAPQFTAGETWLVPQTWPRKTGAMCALPDADKRDCGEPGISNAECNRRGCCNSNAEDEAVGMQLLDTNRTSARGVPSCFYGLDHDQDLYLFAHGHAYKEAMRDFTLVGGKIPLPPREAFGVFYSRYWAWSDVGQMDIVAQYEEHDMPLDVLVTDMDWHITFYKDADRGVRDQAGERIGWTGFTWDKHLFPDPEGFLDWCKSRGLKNTLNLHPASGIQPWEDSYKAMATAMGIDPATNKYVPFNITDLRFTQNWNALTLGPLEQQGVDFWWLDWQQGEDWIALPKVNPTFWLNHVFFTNPRHWNKGGRPLLLHRWGGLGNHRYQVGFSGDVVPSWASLDYQPFFTSRATNVGYSYWSHDIGGHTQPAPNAELYTRWVQFGVFSPVFRSHSTKNYANERRFWAYPLEHFRAMRQIVKLRAALIPYIYTQARATYDTSLGLTLPLYYEWPAAEQAYTFDRQYMFGEALMVAPVTAPRGPHNVTDKQIWVPPGSWVDVFSGRAYEGPQVISRGFTLNEMPVFARAGSIIPMTTPRPPLGQAIVLPDIVKWVVVPGNARSGAGRLYEDSNRGTQYQDSEFAWTRASYAVAANNTFVTFAVAAAQGTFPGQLAARRHVVQFVGVFPALLDAGAVRVNGIAIPPAAPGAGKTAEQRTGAGSILGAFSSPGSDEEDTNTWTYDGSTLSLFVHVNEPVPSASELSVTLELAGSVFDPLLGQGFTGMLARFAAAQETLDNQWGTSTRVYQEDYLALLDAAETGQRVTYACCGQRGRAQVDLQAELKAFAASRLLAIQQVRALSALAPATRDALLAQLSEA